MKPALPDVGRLDAFLGFRLRRLQNLLSRDFALATADRNLRSGLFTALALIEGNPGLSQNELSQEIGLDKSVTVQIVDELERYGWANRQKSPVDRRRHALNVTDAGREQLDQLLGILAQTESVVQDELSAAEIALLHELIDRVYHAYDRLR